MARRGTAHRRCHGLQPQHLYVGNSVPRFRGLRRQLTAAILPSGDSIMRATFIHTADNHLGYEQYGMKERFNDFARAFFADDADYRAVRSRNRQIVQRGKTYAAKLNRHAR